MNVSMFGVLMDGARGAGLRNNGIYVSIITTLFNRCIPASRNIWDEICIPEQTYQYFWLLLNVNTQWYNATPLQPVLYPLHKGE